MIALNAQLPAFLRDEGRPINAMESAEFAQLCFSKKLYADSAQLWSEAFAARPALGGEPGSANYYQAARAAAMASCGNSGDAKGLDSPRNGWREQSLVWMKEELATIASLLDRATARERSEIPKRLGHWQIDPLPHAVSAFAIAFSPAGRTLATGDEHGARLWDRATRRPLGPPEAA
jgi:hypothetical protein